ncbi:MAG TPA: SDR family NAD(P)-dependent oxidoreductase [Candidatus Binatia bacterium]|jgi:short-subunit dehydrogenase|nr:SDR family NAD(P)-dependent oxidoreductase [Candidatus Binatia bacterium]
MMDTSPRPVVVVVGVGAGLGAVLARRFAAEYRVALLARGETYLIMLASEIESAGGRTLVVPTDVNQEQQIEAAFTIIRRG